MADVRDVIGPATSFFASVKAFLKSSAKRFCVLLHASGNTGEWAALVREALTRLFMTAAREFELVCFGTVELCENADLAKALTSAIACEKAPVQTIRRNDTTLVIQLQEAPLCFRNHPVVPIEPGETVVLSGGARGIT